MSASMMSRTYYKVLGFLGFAALGFSLPAFAVPSETATPLSLSTTVIAFKLDSKEIIPVQASFQAAPPVLTIFFPAGKVVSSLPGESVVGEGVIRAFAAHYEPSRGRQPVRYLKTLQISLSAAYPYHVRSEAGQVLIEISHPESVGRASVEVGVKGGTIISGLTMPRISERFHAMQDALAHAAPMSWSMQMDLTPAPAANAAAASIEAKEKPEAAPALEALLPAGRISARSVIRWWPVGLIGIFALFMSITLAAYYILLRPSSGRAAASGYLPSSTALIDQLVWRAFERQGYQVIAEKIFSPSVGGTFRVIQKEGAKRAFFVVGQNAFLEKRTVEQVVSLMHGANLDQGILVASGAFTIPAQRAAKMHSLTLIGREQLAELVGVGAASEYVTKQLERQQAQLSEAMGTLQQYSQELEALRSQRNEATWLLGEQRNQVSSLEAQFSGVSEQLKRYQQELEHWQQEAVTLKKQWEESEWYLGESRARVEYLETQLLALQSSLQRAEAAETRCDKLEQGLQAARARELELETSLSQLKQEVAQAKSFGERRLKPRTRIQEAFVELLNGSSEPMFSGTVRDISASGIGLATDRELLDAIRFRLHLPGKLPVESRAQVIWQRPIDSVPGFVSGFRLLDLSEDAQGLLKAAAATSS